MPPKETKETIKNWLDELDSIIEHHATDPIAVKQDRLLRDLFALAFPPSNLPPKIEFMSDMSEESALNFCTSNHLYLPYYSAKVTTKTKTSAKTGETTTSSKVVLRLKDLEGVSDVLREQGHLRRDTKIREINRKTTGKRKGKWQVHAEKLLKARKSYLEILENLEHHERNARNRGDLAETKRCQDRSEIIRNPLRDR